jgi:hypothetical protein
MTLLANLQEQSGPAPNLKMRPRPVTYTEGNRKKAYLHVAKDTTAVSD